MKKLCESNAVVERGADRKGFNTAGAKNPKLLDQVRNRIRCKHYSIRTEQAYVDWIKKFIFFHGKRHPFKNG